MNTTDLITDKQKFTGTAQSFFNIMFAEALEKGFGQIEIKGFKNGPQHISYHSSIEDAVNASFVICRQGLDVYFGINPRVGGAGKRENVHWVTAFHAEIDYGRDGHKKKTEYDTRNEAFESITRFELKPTIVIHSGGGFHCYWVLVDPVKVSGFGYDSLENVNRALVKMLHADTGTHEICRILRVPGTFNLKLQDNPREVTVVFDDGPKYELDSFKPFLNNSKESKSGSQLNHSDITPADTQSIVWDQEISSLPVSERIKKLIINGKDKNYDSRSEADMAVILSLVNKGISDQDIRSIFEKYRIGEKYREHNAPDDYLRHSIEKAKKKSNLTDDERLDPLFISDALQKDDNGKYHLKIVPFQEYMNKKHMLKFLEKERAFFRYNGKCYEQCTDDRLNHICQSELGIHRELFTPTSKSSFIHFAIGNDLVDVEKAYEDQVRYLTMQNGLYDLSSYQLVPHDSAIFTTNLLPYDYDPGADCPR